MTISVTTDPGQWRQLRQFGTPQSQAALDNNLAGARDRLLTANGLNYERDVQPWVGNEVTVAFLSPQASPPPANTPNALPPVPKPSQATIMILPIRDGLKAQQILGNFKPQAGKVSERIYKGFQIRESQGSTPQTYSATVLDGRLMVVTNDASAMDRAIDTYKGAPALAATPGYTDAVSKIQMGQPFGKLFINLPAAAAVTSANSGRPVSPQSMAQVQQVQGLAATAALEPEGIRFKSISWLKADSQRKYEVNNSARTMPNLLPADTLIMASGGNLKQFWQDYSQGATANPVSPINPEGLRKGLQSTVGMDLDQDFLPWMAGEFSLSMVAAPEGSSPGLPFGLVFMVKTNDRRAAEAALKRLDEAMVSKYRFKVEEGKVGDTPVVNWALPAGGPSITHGWLDGDVAFLSLGAPLVNTFVPKPANSLADSAPFKAAIPPEPNPNNGHFFVNVDRAVNAKNLPLLQLPPGNRDLVAAMRAIGITAAISDDRSTRYDIFVQLQKAGQVNPLPSPKLPGAAGAPSGNATPPLALPSTEPTPSPR
jgi:hypothetical protein